MFKQIILPLLGVIAFIAIVGIFLQKSRVASSKTLMIGDKIVKIEVADTAEKRIKGLSGVTNLDVNSGMLFVFDNKDVTPGFWMKDMLIPLDIIWINDGKIIKIDKNIQSPKAGTPDSKLVVYYPGQPIDYVLELNAGYSDQNNVRVGDFVQMQSGL